MNLSFLEKIEDWFLGLKFVDGKLPEDMYFTWCRLWGKIEDVVWYKPNLFFHNLWTYKKILWSNYWFDSYYLMDLMKTKLEHDAKKYRKFGMTVNADNYAREMEYCALLLKRITDDTYEDEHLEEHDKKWGQLETSTSPSSTHKNCVEMNFKRKRAQTDEEKEQETKEFRQHMQDAWDEKQKDTAKLFDFMKENIYNWWD